ncbi:UPF0061-domain-containing protein [Neoconidiobolus thromboides FSU 785]|nr:UPF0061-domain-containing protein [Neoconidiobolus thromboides FSU 785]
MGDGFAVLRSSVREYLGSEANHALGIPTTRALSLVVTSQLVHRESLEPGAIVCRLSPSWIRFGSFQIFQMTKETEPLRILANYVIKYHFPELIENLEDKDSDCFPVEIYKEFYKEVARRTAKLVASWQAVGFCHGVLNTDNMSILGLTLDYGPFGYFSNLAPSWSPNLSDYTYRYSYKNQPAVGAWNLKMLGQALNPLFEEDNEIIPLPIYDEGEAQCSKFITDVTLLYDDMFLQEFYQLMNKKLGLPTYKVEDEDELVNLLLKLLADNSVDYHNFFRRLSHMTNIFPITKDSVYKDIIKYLLKDGIGNNDMDKIEDENKWLQWLTMYISRLTQEYDEKEITQISKSMLKVNPRFLLRNWVAQEVNDELYKENFKSEKLRIIYDLTCKYPYAEDDEIDYVAHPYLTKEILEYYSGPGTESSKELKCSCSS